MDKSARKRAKELKFDKYTDDENSDEEVDKFYVQGDTFGTFKPLHLLSVWMDPTTMTQRITVALKFPSGVEAGGFSVRVVEGAIFRTYSSMGYSSCGLGGNAQ